MDGLKECEAPVNHLPTAVPVGEMERYIAQDWLDGFELVRINFRGRHLRAMLKRDRDCGQWVAQVVEYDVLTQGDTKHDAIYWLGDLLRVYEDEVEFYPGGLAGIDPPPAWITEKLEARP